MQVTDYIERNRRITLHICPGCNDRHEIFGRGGGERIAKQFQVPFLGAVPLQPRVREGGDQGRPVVVTYPESAEAAAFRYVAGEIARQVSILAVAGQGAFVPAMTLTLKK